ncbi:MAG: glycosyltransferase family 4 protein [Bacteroidia bacterium]|nr:glycosyltransferase family 4 protein [Bacteroidia bacterium]
MPQSAGKICFILPNFHLEFRGGAETQCFFLAQELLRRGWEVHYLRESSQPETKVMEGIVVHSIPKKKAYLKWQLDAAIGAKMAEIKADIWYNRATLAYLPAIVKHARRCGGKVAFAFSRDSQFSYAEFRDTYQKPYMKAYATWEQFWFFRALRRTPLILAQTRTQLRLLRERLGLDGVHIYNAHPSAPDSGPQPPREALILWIARITHYKHPELFVELARRMQGQPFRFVLIGKLEQDELSRQLQEAAAAQPNLTLAGEQSQAEVHAWLRKARALVSTSDVEGFSNTFIEAWLRGVPVVSRLVDPDGIIGDFRLGAVHADLDDMRRILEELLRDEAAWQEMSQRCAAYARAHFDLAEAVTKLEAALRGEALPQAAVLHS